MKAVEALRVPRKPILEYLEERIGKPLTFEDVLEIREHLRCVDALRLRMEQLQATFDISSRAVETNTSAEQYTTAQVAKLAGLTLRQLQWWDERGLISPTSKAGHRRLYSSTEARLAYIAAKLRGRGYSLQKIKSLLRKCERLITHPGARYLATNGTTVKIGSCTRELIRFACKSKKAVVLIELLS